MSAQDHAGLLARLLPVHDALERAAAGWRDDQRVGGFVQPELHRAERVRADLRHLTGSAEALPTPASTAYAQRVGLVAARSAAAFVAHHYTRYLADLSGGQVIRVALERSLRLADGTGTSSLHFPGLRAGAVKAAYRERLDQVAFTEQEREELVTEALLAYRLNVALAAEIEVRPELA